MNFFNKFQARRRIQRSFKRKLGYKPDFKNPQTYCEKIQWLKLNQLGNDPKVIQRADKYAVREFIKDQGFGEQLIPLFGYWSNPNDIDWETLPDSFALKLNNASGPKYRWFVKDKSTFDVQQFINDAGVRMHQKYGHRMGEFHYGKIPPKIIAEELLLEGESPIKDYKFYCFNGEIVLFSIEDGKTGGSAHRAYYNPDWSRFEATFVNDLPEPEQPFVKPENFELMTRMAETLSKGFPLLRVDLYNIDGKIYFGELTYSPEDGITQWIPSSLDLKYGKLIDLSNISH